MAPKQSPDQRHMMSCNRQKYHQVDPLVDAGLMDCCSDNETPSSGYQCARVTEDVYRLLGGVADSKEGEQHRRRFLEAVGLGVQIAAAVGVTLGG